MNYLIKVFKDGEVVATKQTVEHPPESYLEYLKAEHDADFCDVSRK